LSLADIRTVTAELPPRILIHAQEGVGKTTLASRFPKAIFLQCEDGCPSGLTIDSFGPLESFGAVLQAITVLATEAHDYRTVVIDSLDALEPLVWAAVCAEYSWQTIESPGFGKGYVVAGRWWLDALAGLDFLRRQRGMMVVLLAHSAVEIVSDPRAASYTSYQLRLHRRARGLVQDTMDVIGFMAPDLNIQSEEVGFGKKRNRADGGSTRWLHFEGRPSFVAKNRYGLPAKMIVPKEFDFEETLTPFFPKPAGRGGLERGQTHATLGA
jgi:hypothetical protein